jgi:hypothetical protein
MEMIEVSFEVELFKVEGKGGWTFAPVPPDCAPPVTGGWGMTPVEASVEGRAWSTQVWRERSGRVLLPLPRKVRGALGHGDRAQITLRYRRQALWA